MASTTRSDRDTPVRLLFTVLDSTRYTRELATGENGTFRHPLGYTFLTRMRAQGIEAYPVASNGRGASIATRGGYRRLCAAVWKALGERHLVLGHGGVAPIACILNTLRGDERSVFCYMYAANDPRHRGWRAVVSDRLRRVGYNAAAGVVFSTEAERQRAILLYGLDPARTGVLLSGVDTRFFRPHDQPAEGAEFSVQSAGSLVTLTRRGYIFMCGDMLRRDDVVAAALARTDTVLVRTTKKGASNTMDAELAKHPAAKLRVLQLTDVPASDLRELYRNAACCVVGTDSSWQPAGWTSMTESLACGTPTLVAAGMNTSELRALQPEGEAPVVAEWPLSKPAVLTDLAQTYLEGRGDVSMTQRAVAMCRARLDVDVLADEFFASDLWRAFARREVRRRVTPQP